MAQEGLRKTIDRHADDATDVRARALSMLELLLSAQACAELHRIDGACIAQLEKCAERLRSEHALSRPEPDDELAWTESTLPGLLRLLVYLQAEAADSLRDAICAALLEKCVTQMMRTHRLSPDQLCASERDSCH